MSLRKKREISKENKASSRRNVRSSIDQSKRGEVDCEGRDVPELMYGEQVGEIGGGCSCYGDRTV